MINYSDVPDDMKCEFVPGDDFLSLLLDKTEVLIGGVLSSGVRITGISIEFNPDQEDLELSFSTDVSVDPLDTKKWNMYSVSNYDEFRSIWQPVRNLLRSSELKKRKIFSGIHPKGGQNYSYSLLCCFIFNLLNGTLGDLIWGIKDKGSIIVVARQLDDPDLPDVFYVENSRHTLLDVSPKKPVDQHPEIEGKSKGTSNDDPRQLWLF